MERLNIIRLNHVLPQVFVGSEKEETIRNSRIWLKDFEFVRGTHYLVEAESGTGKSSLCSYIYGNRRDYTGRISMNGDDIRSFTIADWCDVRKRHLAFLPQDMRLFGELTVMENIMIKNRLTHHLPEDRIREMLDILGVGNKVGELASRLSIGQQQRVAVVRALCQPFDFILLDEPVSHLDARNNLVVSRLIAEEATRNEASVIATSVGNPLLLRDVEAFENVETVKL